eukprot:CAMPEP_0172563284 /NCGR_PEP_ID=MMETSP1067-20121228/100214_1 /TAXON_ID=265564 ORGANISM="Thalassiosira punctigera, Strain Tpunct2005C2" /NCGR_SAMPLE_ID=MMETSP1067 /ASSEMBLY_ACC=CAM_ASM_000444 /LENGTH=45 /DNA_ID= /DNA_START= /DNA_END= /DNA_ORIENTATION=
MAGGIARSVDSSDTAPAVQNMLLMIEQQWGHLPEGARAFLLETPL